MSEDGSGAKAPRRGHARHARRRHALLRTMTWVSVGLVTVLVAGVAFAVWRLNANVHRVDVTQQLGTDRPTPSGGVTETGALNILLMGSDTRADLVSQEYGSDTIEGGAHSDTTILVHISADRDRVLAVSIPRDSMLPGPVDCSPESPKSQWVVRQWNYNYTKGGAGCSIRALEGNTGVFINNYAVVNFEGFAGMVDALGGVQVCTPVPIEDEASGLSLTAGTHLLQGRDALGYVRVRKTLGDGSDLGRIARQQAFLSSVVQKATDSSLLLRPDRLFSFLSAASQSLTTDPDLGVARMTTIAQSLQKVGPGNIEFVTVPTQTYEPDPNRVQWTNDADAIWEAIKNDRRIGEPASPSPSPSTTSDSATPGGSASPDGTQSPLAIVISPDRISVRVLNGSGTPGIATQTGEALRVQGFAVVGLADASPISGVVVEHSSGKADSARTLAAAFPGARLKVNDSLGDVLQVTVGAGAPAVVAVPNRLGTAPIPSPTVTAGANATATPSISARTAAESICQ